MGSDPEILSCAVDPHMLFHCQPAGVVVGKPVLANLAVKLATGTEMAARFERDSAGNARLELRDPVSQTPLFALLRPSSERADLMGLYESRAIFVRRWPVPQIASKWFFGFFQPEWTDEHQELAGHDARRVLLKGRTYALNTVRDAGECWISEPLMMVLREHVLNEDGIEEEWNITDIEEKPPAGDLLATPSDFRVVDPQRKQ